MLTMIKGVLLAAICYAGLTGFVGFQDARTLAGMGPGVSPYAVGLLARAEAADWEAASPTFALGAGLGYASVRGGDDAAAK